MWTGRVLSETKVGLGRTCYLGLGFGTKYDDEVKMPQRMIRKVWDEATVGRRVSQRVE